MIQHDTTHTLEGEAAAAFIDQFPLYQRAALVGMVFSQGGMLGVQPPKAVPGEPSPPSEPEDIDETLPPLDRAQRLALRRLKRGDATTAQIAEAADRTPKTVANWCADGGPLHAWGARRVKKGVYTWPNPQNIPLDED